MPTQIYGEAKMFGTGHQQLQVGPTMLGGQQSTSSFYQDSVAGGYGNMGVGTGTGTWKGVQDGYYSEFDSKEATAADNYSGLALPDSYLGHYFTQVRNSACVAEKIIEIFIKVTFYTGDCKLLLHH